MHFRTKNLLLVALIPLFLSCANQEEDEEVVSAKKKIAYAPHQTAKFEHSSPNQAINQPINQPINKEQLIHQPSVEPIHTQTNPHAQNLPANPHGQNLPANPHTQNNLPQQLPQNHPTTTAPMGNVSGTIELKGDLIPEIKAGSVLFISVRRYMENGQGTLIAAIKKSDISATSFPMPYVITDKDAMMGAPLGGDVRVTARSDQDGDAISKMPGDLTGATTSKVQVGQNPVNFVIDQKL